MKNKFLIICSVALATLFLACSKAPNNSNNNGDSGTTLSDSCKECDLMKRVILSDDDVSNDVYVDSLYCSNISNACVFKNSDHNNFIPYSAKHLLGMNYYALLYLTKDYERVYADFMPNADTPYVGPVYFAFDYNYNTQNKLTQIKGEFNDYLYYFDANYIMYEKGEPVVRPQMRPLDNFKYPNYRLVQKNDTFTYFHDRKKLYINNQIVIMPVYYTMVLDHEKDEMSLRAEFYKTVQDRQKKIPPIYVSTRYRLKRV